MRKDQRAWEMEENPRGALMSLGLSPGLPSDSLLLGKVSGL